MNKIFNDMFDLINVMLNLVEGANSCLQTADGANSFFRSCTRPQGFTPQPPQAPLGVAPRATGRPRDPETPQTPDPWSVPGVASERFPLPLASVSHFAITIGSGPVQQPHLQPGASFGDLKDDQTSIWYDKEFQEGVAVREDKRVTWGGVHVHEFYDKSTDVLKHLPSWEEEDLFDAVQAVAASSAYRWGGSTDDQDELVVGDNATYDNNLPEYMKGRLRYLFTAEALTRLEIFSVDQLEISEEMIAFLKQDLLTHLLNEVGIKNIFDREASLAAIAAMDESKLKVLKQRLQDLNPECSHEGQEISTEGLLDRIQQTLLVLQKKTSLDATTTALKAFGMHGKHDQEVLFKIIRHMHASQLEIFKASLIQNITASANIDMQFKDGIIRDMLTVIHECLCIDPDETNAELLQKIFQTPSGLTRKTTGASAVTGAVFGALGFIGSGGNPLITSGSFFCGVSTAAICAHLNDKIMIHKRLSTKLQSCGLSKEDADVITTGIIGAILAAAAASVTHGLGHLHQADATSHLHNGGEHLAPSQSDAQSPQGASADLQGQQQPAAGNQPDVGSAGQSPSPDRDLANSTASRGETLQPGPKHVGDMKECVAEWRVPQPIHAGTRAHTTVGFQGRDISLGHSGDKAVDWFLAASSDSTIPQHTSQPHHATQDQQVVGDGSGERELASCPTPSYNHGETGRCQHSHSDGGLTRVDFRALEGKSSNYYRLNLHHHNQIPHHHTFHRSNSDPGVGTGDYTPPTREQIAAAGVAGVAGVAAIAAGMYALATPTERKFLCPGATQRRHSVPASEPTSLMAKATRPRESSWRQGR